MNRNAAPELPNQLDMLIGSELLERICMRTIETILMCLEHAMKGTIYRIGNMPDLRAVRITSGIRREGNEQIEWGLPEASDYDPPGKAWEQYRDEPHRALEAMGWCVEKQKSWTSDNPYEDSRSVQRQVFGEAEDFHHMEPVLVNKKDFYGNRLHNLEYPVDYTGMPIWDGSDHIVVAVIKIHFLPYTLRRGDRSTKVIKMLSQTLGTEMLSFYVRESLMKGQKELTRQRLESCNVLAHELRNTLAKLNFTFRVINAEISSLREHWESELRKTFPDLQDKLVILNRLNELLREGMSRLYGSGELIQLAEKLLAEGEQLLTLCLLPTQEEQWLNNKILPKWDRLLSEAHVWDTEQEEIRSLLQLLKDAIWIGMDADLARRMIHLPEDLRTMWPRLVYTPFSPERLSLLDDIVQLLHHPALNLPYKHHTRKVFTYLKALAKIIPEAEERANTVISYLKSGISLEEV